MSWVADILFIGGKFSLETGMGKLPSSGRAVVDIAKLRDYCLNPNHPEGRHKARVFLAALGIRQKDAEWLAEQIRQKLPTVDFATCETTPFGERYDVDMVISNGEKETVVRTGWVVRKSDGVPRLVTCFVR